LHKIQQKLRIVKQEKCLHLNYFYLTTPRTDATSSVQVNHSTENILFVTSVYKRLFNQPRKSNSNLAGARLMMARQLVHGHQDNTAARKKACVAHRLWRWHINTVGSLVGLTALSCRQAPYQ